MKRPSILRVHWPAFVVIMLVGAIFILAWAVPGSTRLGKAFGLLAVMVPALIAAAQYLYARVDRWRLAVNRLRLRATNRETNWSVRCEFVVPSGTAAVAKVEEILTRTATASSRDARLLAGEPRKRAWLWQGMTVRLLATVAPDILNEDQDEVLIVEVPTLRRAFRSLERSIRDEVGPLLAVVERDVEPTARKYSVRIEFPDANPYFGLFVSNVSRDMVTRFDIDMIELEPVTGDRDVVKVHQDRIDLVASSAHAVERLTMRYLSLEPITGGS